MMFKDAHTEVADAVNRQIADLFYDAVRMVNTERMLQDWLATQTEWRFSRESSHRWWVSKADGTNNLSFTTWEQCLEFLLKQVEGNDLQST